MVGQQKQKEEDQGYEADAGHYFSFANSTAQLGHQQTAEERADVDSNKVHNLCGKRAKL